MTERMPRVTGPEVVCALERVGWQRVQQEGSNLHLRHPTRPRCRCTAVRLCR